MRRLVRLAVLAAAALVLLATALWGVSHTEMGREFARARVLSALGELTDAHVRLGRIGGTLGWSLVLEDLRLSVGGREVVRVDRVHVRYSTLALLRGRLRFWRVLLESPRVRLVRGRGGWRLPALRETGGGSPPSLRIRRLVIRDGRAAVAFLDGPDPRRLAATAIDLEAAVRVEGERREVDLHHLRFVPRGVAVSPASATGHLVARADGSFGVRGFDFATARTRIAGEVEATPAALARAAVFLGPLDAEELRALAPWTGVRADLHARLEGAGPWNALGVGGRVTAGDASVDVAARVDATARPPRWTGRARFVALDPGALVEGLVSARLDGRARARGRGLGLRAPVSYRAALDASHIAGWPLDRLVVSGEATNGVHHARVRLAAPAGEAHVRARLGLQEPPTLRLAARVDATRLEAAVPALPGAARARLTLEARGTTPPDRRATLAVTLGEATVRGIRVDEGVLEADLEGDRLRADARVRGPDVEVAAGGTGDVARRTVDARGTAGGSLAALASGLAGTFAAEGVARGPVEQLGIEASVTVDGPAYGALHAARARVALTAVRRPDGVRGEVRELTVVPRGTPSPPAWTLAHRTPFTLAADAVATDDLRLVAGEQSLRLAGRIARRGANGAALEATRVSLAPACGLAGGPACRGELSGRIDLAGTAAAPVLSTKLTAAELAVEGVAYGRLDVGARYAERAVRVDAVLDHPTAGALALDGSVPVDLAWDGPRQDLGQAPLALRLHAERLDLAAVQALAPGALRETAGRVTVDLRLGGPRGAPRAEGRIALDDGRLRLTAAGATYRDVRARLVATGPTLTLTEFHARGAKGHVEGSGHVDLVAGAAPVLDLAFRVENFLAVDRPAYEAAASGTIGIQGPASAPTVEGDLDVVHGVVRLAALPTSGAALEPDPTITVVGGPPPPDTEARTAASSLADPVRLGVTLRLGRDVWIRRSDARIRLGGDLFVEKAPFEPVRLAGEVRLVRGWYAFQGRRFDIDEGAVRFGEAEPQLAVTAVYRTTSYRIEVHVDGPLAKPRLSLSSDPPMDDVDILSVLLFGKRSSDLGRGESAGLQRQAIGLAAGYAAPELRESVLSTFGIDTFDVGMPGSTGEPGWVSLGAYVTQDVFVSLAQEFGSRVANVASLEYGVMPNVSVRGSTSTRGTGAIDIFWHRRY